MYSILYTLHLLYFKIFKWENSSVNESKCLVGYTYIHSIVIGVAVCEIHIITFGFWRAVIIIIRVANMLVLVHHQ